MDTSTKILKKLDRCLSEWSDEELILTYRETGDRQLFELLVRRYERELYTYLRQFLGDSQLAEDVFQATFLSVHLRVDQFQEGKRFRPWLFAISTNKAIDFQRRNKRHRLTSLDAPDGDRVRGSDTIGSNVPDKRSSPMEDSMVRESGERIRAALEQLPEVTQSLLQLAFFHGMKYQDIGKILGIPLGTVKSRVHTAMRKLYSIWERMYPEDELLKQNSNRKES